MEVNLPVSAKTSSVRKSRYVCFKIVDRNFYKVTHLQIEVFFASFSSLLADLASCRHLVLCRNIGIVF